MHCSEVGSSFALQLLGVDITDIVLPKQDLISSKQIVALRRLDWIADKLQQRQQHLLQTVQGKTPSVSKRVQEAMLRQCQQQSPGVSWGRWDELLDLLSLYPYLTDREGKRLFEEIQVESIDEMFFEGRKHLIGPLNESAWCTSVIKLTEKLCHTASFCLWGSKRNEEKYVRLALQMASTTAGLMRQTQMNDLKPLSFVASQFNDKFVRITEAINSELPTRVIVARDNCQNDQLSTWEQRLRGCASALSESKVVNVDWYICRQVVVLVHGLVPSVIRNKRIYSLHALCDELNLPVDLAVFSLNEPLEQKRTCSERDETVSTAVIPQGTRLTEDVNELLFWGIIWRCLREEMGWRIERGIRPQHFHIFPPGVSRGRGFKPRIDYFNSIKQGKLPKFH